MFRIAPAGDIHSKVCPRRCMVRQSLVVTETGKRVNRIHPIHEHASLGRTLHRMWRHRVGFKDSTQVATHQYTVGLGWWSSSTSNHKGSGMVPQRKAKRLTLSVRHVYQCAASTTNLYIQTFCHWEADSLRKFRTVLGCPPPELRLCGRGPSQTGCLSASQQ